MRSAKLPELKRLEVIRGDCKSIVGVRDQPLALVRQGGSHGTPKDVTVAGVDLIVAVTATEKQRPEELESLEEQKRGTRDHDSC